MLAARGSGREPETSAVLADLERSLRETSEARLSSLDDLERADFEVPFNDLQDAIVSDSAE